MISCSYETIACLKICLLLGVRIRPGKVAVEPSCAFLLLRGIFVDAFIIESQVYAVSLWQFIFLYIKTGLFQIF